MIGDLHCHTRISDGSMGIEDVIAYAKRIELSFLSITDHDTMSGVMRAKVLGKRYGIEVVPGCEISSIDPDTGRKIHILCYLPTFPERLEHLFVRVQEERTVAGSDMLKKVMRSYPVTLEHVLRYTSGSKVIYKAHIMNALMDLGFCAEIYGSLFDKLFSPDHGSCFVDFTSPSVYDVLDLVHEAQGIAVLAHPPVYGSMEFMEEAAKKHKIDGVELWHPETSQTDAKKIADIAKEYGLLVTGGSDY
ncbi:MAG: PHP domain-containing protein, partial [Acetanaerobacterium sp.]